MEIFRVIRTNNSSGGFWYGTFSIGESKDLSLLIDTGSNDVAVNPGLYKPSSQSENLHQKGELQYATAQSNGCGFADIHYHTYADTVSMVGLTAQNQTFAKVKKTPPPNPQTISVFPHQGLVGFGGVRANETQLGGTPFFQQLCDQGIVDECRFGLAYGTGSQGKQILGGVDHALFNGNLHESPIDTSTGTTVAIVGDLVYETPKGKTQRLKDQSILFDSGTANIVGTGSKVQQLFEDLGIQAVNQTSKACKNVLYGYYSCDSPAKVGFTVGGETFYVEPSAFKLADNGDNNCTATITAVNEDFPFWIVGQSVSGPCGNLRNFKLTHSVHSGSRGNMWTSNSRTRLVRRP